MPTSFDLAELREMHLECRSLTGCQVLFYSGIPSLIYSVMTDHNFKFENRFVNIDPKPRVDDEFVLNFLNEFLMGIPTTSPTAPLRSFDCLLSTTTPEPVTGCCGSWGMQVWFVTTLLAPCPIKVRSAQ